MEIKPQLHSSQMASYFRCGESFRRRYIEGEVIPPGVALVVGSAVHKSIEKDLGEKINHGSLLADDAVGEVAASTVNTEWEKTGVELSEDEKALGQKAARGKAVDRAVAFAQFHHSAVAPILRPKFVERPWVLKLEGFSYDLAGTIDVQEAPTSQEVDEAIATIAHKGADGLPASGTNLTGSIRDTKTRSKSPPRTVADTSDQITMYALAAKVLDGVMPEKLVMDNLVQTPKLSQLRHVPLETQRDDKDVQVLFRRIEQVVNALEKGVFLPAPRDSWVCDRRYCGYYDTCPYVHGKIISGGDDGKQTDTGTETQV